MQHRICTCFCLAVSLALVTQAGATPFVIDLQPGSSSVTADVCINIESFAACDDDTSTVSGTVYMNIDDKGVPTEIILYDFDWTLNEQLDVVIDFGLAGDVTATGSNVTITDPTSGTAGITSVGGGVYNFGNVLAQTGGTVSYNVPSLICALMPGGTPCSDTLDMSTFPAEYMALSGTINVAGDPSITLTPSLVLDVLPDNPGMVTMDVSGTLYGTGTYIEAPATSEWATLGLAGLVFVAGVTIITRRGMLA